MATPKTNPSHVLKTTAPVDNSTNNLNTKWNWDGPLKNNMSELLTSGAWSDIAVIIPELQYELRLHKIVLQAGSPVFDRKITAAVEASGRLLMKYLDSDIFQMMIKYLYTGNTDATMIQALPLRKMATEFEVRGLAEQCDKLLRGSITESNALPLFEAGMEYQDSDLIKSSLRFILGNADKILIRDEFAYLRLECLIEIIQQDQLSVGDEMQVFDAVYRWGWEECVRQQLDATDKKDLRKVLAKPLQHVRFPLMDSTKFALHVATKNILDVEESMALLICFLVPHEQRKAYRLVGADVTRLSPTGSQPHCIAPEIETGDLPQVWGRSPSLGMKVLKKKKNPYFEFTQN